LKEEFRTKKYFPIGCFTVATMLQHLPDSRSHPHALVCCFTSGPVSSTLWWV